MRLTVAAPRRNGQPRPFISLFLRLQDSFHPLESRPMSIRIGIILLIVSAEGWTETPSHRVPHTPGPFFLCDQRVVEDHWLVERFVAAPKRHPKNPLIIKQHPWEGTGPHLAGSVLRDPNSGKLHMWYSVWNPHAYEHKLPFSYNVCYAESDNGIEWRKPSLGVFQYDGSTQNNCIKLGTDKTQNIDVCWNPRPDLFPGRFLAIHNQKGGVFVSSSEDGHQFQRLFESPAIAYHSDTHNNFVFDAPNNRWLLFCRPRAWAGYHRRRVALQISHDLQHWTHERTILIPTEIEIPEYYGMTVFRRSNLFFGIVQIYDHETGLFHGELAWSSDGQHWDMLPTHPPFIRRGKSGRWDAGMAVAADAPIEVADELHFYYGGFPLDHNQMTDQNQGSIGLMTCQRDRLVGFRPRTDDPGFIMTRPLVVLDRRLLINAIVRGKIVAELRTDNNKTIDGWSFQECDPLTVSGLEQELTWRGKSLKAVPHEEVRVLFRLHDSDIFTFDLVNSDS